MERRASHLKQRADNCVVGGEQFGRGMAEEAVRKGLEDAGVSVEGAQFGGECSQNESDRLRAVAEKSQCSAVRGIGRGKTLETAQALAHLITVPVAIAPTLASTESPVSATSVLYTQARVVDRYTLLPHT
ncbi:iron-containing alcohol dehydrogenase, partial [Salmonella enterica]|uniref:iron-containing alcohol dehydrogenase n=1 Tax=Salmonella enterica TaxID=28901 RepID=UPI00398C7C9E